jgi:hypothetical protein
MRLFLPAHSEDVGYTKVGDLLVSSIPRNMETWVTYLDMTPAVQQQVLWLDITVRDTHRVEVLNTQQDLLERAFDFSARHSTLFDSGV